MCEYSSYSKQHLSVLKSPMQPCWCFLFPPNNNTRLVIRFVVNYQKQNILYKHSNHTLRLLPGSGLPLMLICCWISESPSSWLLMRWKDLNKCWDVIWSIIEVQLIRISKHQFSNICSCIIPIHQINVECRTSRGYLIKYWYCDQLMSAVCPSHGG